MENIYQTRASKRALDLIICLLLLPFTLLLMAVISVLIMLDSPGPALLLQERVGLQGKRFRMYKFRTMICNRTNDDEREYMKKFISGQIAESQGTLHKPIKKTDITRLGKILRKCSLDELPQLLNVLKGDMSLIGPRPNVPWEAEAYKDWHLERLQALPGITGLAQVMGRSCLSFDEIVQFDIQYVRMNNFKMDIWIAWKTIATVFSRNGAG
jgi:lipopolysaccharide/colanic/teichoic acid biosynthesis glycosyltransferase